MLDATVAPRIYVACLASYNAGILHGRWIDATTDTAEMAREIDSMLKGSPCPNVMRAEFLCPDCGETYIRDVSPYGGAGSHNCPDCDAAMEMQGAPYPSAEEYAIHDYEGLGPDLGEYAGLGEVARRVAIAEAAEDAGIPVKVLIEAMRDLADKDADPEEFIQDRYRGDHSGACDVWADFAQTFHEETSNMDAIPEWVRYHIDWRSLGIEMSTEGDFSEFDGHFFWAN